MDLYHVWFDLKPGVRDLEVCDATKTYDQMTLTLALSYGGRDEIVDAAKALAAEVKAGTLAPDAIDAARFAAKLYDPQMPDPDLLVRTSGEMRISNFLLWQIAYTELLIVPTLWPDFTPRDFYLAVADFQHRRRRFGGLGLHARGSALPDEGGH